MASEGGEDCGLAVGIDAGLLRAPSVRCLIFIRTGNSTGLFRWFNVGTPLPSSPGNLVLVTFSSFSSGCSSVDMGDQQI